MYNMFERHRKEPNNTRFVLFRALEFIGEINNDSVSESKTILTRFVCVNTHFLVTSA